VTESCSSDGREVKSRFRHRRSSGPIRGGRGPDSGAEVRVTDLFSKAGRIRVKASAATTASLWRQKFQQGITGESNSIVQRAKVPIERIELPRGRSTGRLRVCSLTTPRIRRHTGVKVCSHRYAKFSMKRALLLAAIIFRLTPACVSGMEKVCVERFDVYDISAGLDKRTKLASLLVPSGAKGVVKGISVTTPSLLFESGKHLLAVTAHTPEGQESDPLKCATWVELP
jgi:hypothetical protein